MNSESAQPTRESWTLGNYDGQRPGLLEVIVAFQDWIDAGYPGGTFSGFVCCRYGKSDGIRNMALLAIAKGISRVALVVSPWRPLAQQFLERSRMTKWKQRWLPDGPRLYKIKTLDYFNPRSMGNDEWLGSIHIQALNQQVQTAVLLEWVEHRKYTDGVPPIFFFDEVQYFSSNNKWGEVPRKLKDAGCPVVVMTATPFRNDDDDVFGFLTNLTDETKGRQIKYVHPCRENPNKVELHTVTRDETEYEVRGHVNIPFSQGWQEGCIAKASLDLIDWHMKGWGKGRENDERLLSQIPQEEARAILPTMYRDRTIIAEAVRRALAHIETFRKDDVTSEAAIIWYGMNDIRGGWPNQNQELIRDVILEQSPAMQVAIATLADGASDDEEEADQTIAKFVDPNKKWFDALIVKQMGATGLDSDRICVVVLWNTTRALGQMIQMMMRGGNAALKSHFVLIGLADSMTTDRLDAFVKEQGGKFIETEETDHKMTLIDKTDPTHSGYIPVDVAANGMGDTDGRTATFEGVCRAMRLIGEIPRLFRDKSIPVIAEIAERLGITVSDYANGSFTDTTRLCDVLRTQLSGLSRDIGRQLFKKENKRWPNKKCKEDMEKLPEYFRRSVAWIKSRSGVDKSWDADNKERSEIVDDYRKWFAAANQIVEEVANQ